MFQKYLWNMTLSFIFALIFFVPVSAAQQSSSFENRRNEYGFCGGISFDATTLIGKTPDARFGNIGLRYGRILAAIRILPFHGPSMPFRLLYCRRGASDSSP